MKKLFNQKTIAFLAKWGVICNVFYLISLLIMVVKWFSLPDFMANFIALLGLGMSPGVNLFFLLSLLGAKWARNSIHIPNWQTISIMIILSIQIIIQLVSIF